MNLCMSPSYVHWNFRKYTAVFCQLIRKLTTANLTDLRVLVIELTLLAGSEVSLWLSLSCSINRLK